jgi:hypothetical protein
MSPNPALSFYSKGWFLRLDYLPPVLTASPTTESPYGSVSLRVSGCVECVRIAADRASDLKIGPAPRPVRRPSTELRSELGSELQVVDCTRSLARRESSMPSSRVCELRGRALRRYALSIVIID